MPLHLLGKKSWNVYNQANIDRVRRDEAEAAAREEAEEQRQQENDAARRLAILRGEEPPPLLLPAASEGLADSSSSSRRRPPSHGGDQQHDGDGSRVKYERPNPGDDRGGRRKRKRWGGDDTDFEMRIARDRVGARRGDDDADKGGDGNEETRSRHGPHEHRPRNDAPIVDHSGHIDLFPEERDRAMKENDKRLRDSSNNKHKNPDAEREKANKQREVEDQYTMRFSNAAGRDAAGQLTGGKGPWYAGHGSLLEEATSSETPRRDAFGREDPGRKARDEMRIDASDPLAMMKRGAAKVREVEKERQKANEERELELRALRKEERRRREKRSRRHRGGSADSLDGFSLDKPDHSRDKAHHSRTHRESDRTRSRDRHHRDERRHHRHSDSHKHDHRH
ncbi:uncharacterized protein B0I36DRAFT_4795 [Microdochium trichocladiopsis]|uniref:CBF1-interacting co-repressor CIR N-terminal domain-containing protein n=1 Tax=Microdochium trichocladiopsis TaxID=1682393 RepID=A0A9P8YIP3_9PEZI|nr:uncharacterized protein B0I36DRAFT_4795 [Microdochium trichocladiopsis]KAH7040051.1 hypothetical protein B0I36DRAFT_4795 [Microdochium trichocladiopsis]